MALGTLDRTPPPFFRQGTSALTKLSFFSALALFLMVADTRFHVTLPLRAVLATALHPAQRALLVPVAAWSDVSEYALGLKHALDGEAERAMRGDQLAAENAKLRELLSLRASLALRAQAAQVLYDATDPYSRKVIIDRGATSNIALASPVINEAGVLGQVTRVYPLSSEVTLLTDKDAAIPVLNTRTQARSAAFGYASAIGNDALELRFMAGNADVQVGDTLTTSGVDGIYPPGVPVAKVVSVERKVDSGFARILLAPTASPDGVRHVLVLEPVGVQMPPRPEPAPEEVRPARRGARK